MATPGASSSTANLPVNIGKMTDAQLKQHIQSLSQTQAAVQYQPYASPTPQKLTAAYQKHLQNLSNPSTPPPRTASGAGRRTRPAKSSSLAPTAAVQYATSLSIAAQGAVSAPAPTRRNPPSTPLPTVPQALQTTYASRLRTGTTLLVQPSAPLTSGAQAGVGAVSSSARPRRGGLVSYVEPGSGDELPDAGELDSEGSDKDFVASGGLRTSIRATRLTTGPSAHPSPRPTPFTGASAGAGRGELDQSYLGGMPPSRFITAKPAVPTRHEVFTEDQLEAQAEALAAPIPIRVEFETDTHRIRDCFIWDSRERLLTPEVFARSFCADLDLPATPWADMVAAQIRAQIEENEPVANIDLAVDGTREGSDDVAECRVVLSIDVQIESHHLMDHIEWDLCSTLTPEAFARQLCIELGLAGEAAPLIAHAVHEELLKHKKDAIEWGVIGSNAAPPSSGMNAALMDTDGDRVMTMAGTGIPKDKTGLGMGWSRTPREGRGPRVLRSVWRDWAEAEEFGTRFEELTAEEVERREIERERASRRLRRETSKFQSSTRTRRR